MAVKPSMLKPASLLMCISFLMPCSAFAVTVSTCGDLQAMSLNLQTSYTLINDIDCKDAPFIPIGTTAQPFKGTLDGMGHKISNLSNNSLVAGDYIGLFGVTSSATIKNLVLENVNMSSNTAIGIGSLAGMTKYTTIQNVSSSGAVIGLTRNPPAVRNANGLGGMIGIADGQSALKNDSSTVKVTGNVFYVATGGLVGQLIGNASIARSHANGAVSGLGPTGGLVGYINNASILESFAAGPVEMTRSSYLGGVGLGGLVGLIEYSHSVSNPLSPAPVYISRCYASGDVGQQTQNTYVGGLVGGINQVDDSSCQIKLVPEISDSYAQGKVSGYSYVGGLVGYAATGYFYHSYSTGRVFVTTSPAFGGGFAGSAKCTFVDSSYWDMDKSGYSTSATTALGKTSMQMYKQNTYVAWDFSNIWYINGNYPILRINM